MPAPVQTGRSAGRPVDFFSLSLTVYREKQSHSHANSFFAHCKRENAEPQESDGGEGERGRQAGTQAGGGKGAGGVEGGSGSGEELLSPADDEPTKERSEAAVAAAASANAIISLNNIIKEIESDFSLRNDIASVAKPLALAERS